MIKNKDLCHREKGLSSEAETKDKNTFDEFHTHISSEESNLKGKEDTAATCPASARQDLRQHL